jgi:hypothetical protein
MGYYIKYIISITMIKSVIQNSEPGYLASYSNQRKLKKRIRTNNERDPTWKSKLNKTQLDSTEKRTEHRKARVRIQMTTTNQSPEVWSMTLSSAPPTRADDPTTEVTLV